MKFVSADNCNLQYMGRIGKENQTRSMIYPYSMVRFRVRTTRLALELTNHRVFWNSYLGAVVDGISFSVEIPSDDTRIRLMICSNMEDTVHDIILFKRMDGCHMIHLHGILLDETAQFATVPDLPRRKIEVYGDSVSAGEVSEAVDYVGKEDPPHQGEYSNSWYSYAAIAARNLGAQLHDIAQGGIALENGTGWFHEPNYLGMEHMWDKMQYNPEFGECIRWDFTAYCPQVVIVAIGQNDSHPVDLMKRNYDGAAAKNWRCRYYRFVQKLRGIYPMAYIILCTTILEHDPSWDRAIEEVCAQLSDPAISHFLYQNNGCGTKGHIRIPEAEQMAQELTNYIETLGPDVWTDKGV